MSTTGLIFFGTPFRGAAGMSQIEILETARQEYLETKIPWILRERADEDFLEEVVDQFGKTRRWVNKARVTCFYELKWSIGGKIGLVGLGKGCVFRLKLTIFAEICRG